MSQKTVSTLLAAIMALSFSVSFTGCKGAQKKSSDESSGAGTVSESDINSDLADSDSGKAAGLQTVYYPFDSSTLSAEAKTTLQNNAQLLKDKASLKIQIEGHTDEQGGIQYNIALGERRAKSAKSFLIDHGVSANRITTISYGKEKPVDPGHSEEAWSKNRRANFRITEK